MGIRTLDLSPKFFILLDPSIGNKVPIEKLGLVPTFSSAYFASYFCIDLFEKLSNKKSHF
jgi:hypothetical protein